MSQISHLHGSALFTVPLKYKFCLCWPIDHYGTNPGGQATLPLRSQNCILPLTKMN